MSYKEVLSLAGIVLTFVMFVPYIRSIQTGRTTPHVFSWVIWGVGTFVVFLAQLAGHAGVGAWPIGVSGIITLYIAGLAYFKSRELAITNGRLGIPRCCAFCIALLVLEPKIHFGRSSFLRSLIC